MQRALMKKVVAGTFRVFLSYSTKDLALAQQVEATMKAAGAEVFLADQSVQPGEVLKSKIAAAIHACDLFLVIWSKHSAESEWVRHEMGQAAALKKRVVPFLLDKQVAVPGFFSDVKYIPAYDGVDAGTKALAQLVASLQNEKRQAIADQQSTAALLAIGGLIFLAVLSKE
jgi:hypothetical protein